jgi:hypothetical protein
VRAVLCENQESGKTQPFVPAIPTSIVIPVAVKARKAFFNIIIESRSPYSLLASFRSPETPIATDIPPLAALNTNLRSYSTILL